MTKPSIKHQQQGFTLIEVLMYIAIFTLIIGAIVGLAVLSSLQRVQSQVIASTNFQGEAVLALIEQTISSATSVTTPTVGSSSSSLVLAMPASSANPTSFASANDGTTNRLQISEGSPANLNYLTNARVSLSGLSFANNSVSGSKASILIQFTLTYRVGSAGSSYAFAKTFNGAAGLP